MSDAILETFDLYDICSEWWGDLTWPKKALRCCDIWDTDYNTDNWEPEFMTFFVAWQLIVTLDSIRNSCDVLYSKFFFKQIMLDFRWKFRVDSYSTVIIKIYYSLDVTNFFHYRLYLISRWEYIPWQSCSYSYCHRRVLNIEYIELLPFYFCGRIPHPIF